MMIKPVLCPTCGEPKKTRQSTYCHKCANRKNTGHHWTQEELETLKLIYKHRVEIRSLHEKLCERHSRVAQLTKAKHLGLKWRRI